MARDSRPEKCGPILRGFSNASKFNETQTTNPLFGGGKSYDNPGFNEDTSS